MLWENAIEGYWLEKRKNVSPATVADYNGTFRRFRASLGEQPVQFEHVSTDQVRRFLASLHDAGKAPKSVCNAWIALSSLWTWAQQELSLPHIIRGRVARPRYRRPAIEPYSKTEVRAMLEAASRNAPWVTKHGRTVEEARDTGWRDRAILLVLVDSGLRASELCDLCVDDYDQKTGKTHVRHGKGNKSRYVWLGEVARKAVWRYLAERGAVQPEYPLFATRSNGHMDKDSLRHMIQRCAKRAGVTGATVHRFRHTFAITYLRNKGTMLELQRLLGHERMDMLRIYAELAESDLESGQRRASPADNWRL